MLTALADLTVAIGVGAGVGLAIRLRESKLRTEEWHTPSPNGRPSPAGKALSPSVERVGRGGRAPRPLNLG